MTSSGKENRGRPSGRPHPHDAEVIQLHAQGLNDLEIGKKLGIAARAIGRHRKRLGLQAQQRRPLSHADEIIRLHAQGLDDLEIEEKLGLAPKTIWRHRKRLGLKTQRRRPGAHEEKIIRLHARGLDDLEIAGKLGLPSTTVRHHRQQLGLQAHRNRHFPEQEIDRAQTLLGDGRSYAEVGRILGRTRGSIQALAQREGFAYEGYRRRANVPGNDEESEVDGHVLSAIRRAPTMADAARRAGVSVQEIKEAMAQQPGLLGRSLEPVLDNTTGEAAKWEERWGAAYILDFHQLVADCGTEKAALWLERTEQDIAALIRLRDKLAGALKVAQVLRAEEGAA